jgi:hypothetical protein
MPPLDAIVAASIVIQALSSNPKGMTASVSDRVLLARVGRMGVRRATSAPTVCAFAQI